MINNNKGAILLITVVSMMILTIIGYITLQMVSSQGVMDTYDHTKIRVDYAAEAIVERARGYIDYLVVQKSTPMPTPVIGSYGDVGSGGKGLLYSMVDGSVDNRWFLLENAEGVDSVKRGHVFDNSMYPNIFAGDIYCEFVTEEEDGFVLGTDVSSDQQLKSKVFILNPTSDENPKCQTYRIVAVASATVNVAGGTVIVSTVTYYFNSRHYVDKNADGTVEKHVTKQYSMGWRKQS
ncbi:hypothetical protein [Candidatus Ruminimicrobiellum ovillum]|uniref:hypothetical protein n=1 Tax=Candidatus Ruminimicrobiellum ovillum TaxID=1947927 RepID=UPI00355954DB